MKKLLTGTFLVISFSAFAQTAYQMPPTSSTRAHVPVISDAMMEKCVKIYNEAKWLQNELNSTSVDRYSQASVDKYNNKVHQLNQMTNWFNQECAGKQSRSACEATQKLNRERGLPVQPCR